MSSETKIETTRHKHYLLVKFINYEKLDLYNVVDLTELFQRENQNGVEDWIIDLSTIEFIDSSGLGALARQGGVLAKKNKKLNLVSILPSVSHLFRAMGFEKLFKISESIDFID